MSFDASPLFVFRGGFCSLSGLTSIFACLPDDQNRRVAQRQADPSLVDRVDELVAKANEGERTDEEREVYKADIEANNPMAIHQAEARFP